MRKTIIIVSILILAYAAFWVVAVRDSNQAGEPAENGEGAGDPMALCLEQGGKWLADYKECEGADKEWCEGAGGEFDECASACRHIVDAEACIERCVPVCDFGQDKPAEYGSTPRNAAYVIEGETVKLEDGRREKPVSPGATAYFVTSIYGQPVQGDMDNDGDTDYGLVLEHDLGSPGTYYYAAIAAQDEDGWFKGSNAVLLGDRIEVQDKGIGNLIYNVDYLDRADGEPADIDPTVEKSVYLKYENGVLMEADEKDGLIRLDNPNPGEEISSPLTVSGEARGNWYFEAEFPLVLVDWDGRIIAEGQARAQGEWMTEDYVPFSGTLEFAAPDTSVSDRGALILRKANPSGLPENDNALEVSVYFE